MQQGGMMETRFRTLAILGTGLTAALAAWALDSGSTQFLTAAIHGNAAEVKMGDLALQRGNSKEVRDFGKTLVKDHSVGLEKSSSLAQKLGMVASPELTAEATKDYEAMARLSGAEFDRQFAAHMVKDHKKDLAAYRDQAQDGNNPQVAAYAQETLPTLQKHLEIAQTIDGDLKAKKID